MFAEARRRLSRALTPGGSSSRSSSQSRRGGNTTNNTANNDDANEARNEPGGTIITSSTDRRNHSNTDHDPSTPTTKNNDRTNHNDLDERSSSSLFLFDRVRADVAAGTANAGPTTRSSSSTPTTTPTTNAASAATATEAAAATAAAAQSKDSMTTKAATATIATAAAAAAAAFPLGFWETQMEVELRQNIGNSLRCGICLTTVVNPVRSHCCHVFCKACFQALLMQSSSSSSSKKTKQSCKCPMCQSPVNRRSVTEDPYMSELAAAFKATTRAFGMVPGTMRPDFTTLTQMMPNDDSSEDENDDGKDGDDEEKDDHEKEEQQRSRAQQQQQQQEEEHHDRLNRLAVATTWQVHALPHSTKATKSHKNENNQVVAANLEDAMELVGDSMDIGSHVGGGGGGGGIDSGNVDSWQVYYEQQRYGSKHSPSIDEAALATAEGGGAVAATTAAATTAMTVTATTPRVGNNNLSTTNQFQVVTTAAAEDWNVDDNNDADTNEDNVSPLSQGSTATVTPLPPHVGNSTRMKKTSRCKPMASSVRPGKNKNNITNPLPSTQEVQEQAREQISADQEMNELEEEEKNMDDEKGDDDDKTATMEDDDKPADAVAAANNSAMGLNDRKKEDSQRVQRDATQSQTYASAMSSLSQTQSTMDTARQDQYSQQKQQHSQELLEEMNEKGRPLLDDKEMMLADVKEENATPKASGGIKNGNDEDEEDGMEFALHSSSPPHFARPITGSSPRARHTYKSYSKRDSKGVAAGMKTFQTAYKDPYQQSSAKTPLTAPLTDIAIRTTAAPSVRGSGDDCESSPPPFETSMEMSPIAFMASQAEGGYSPAASSSSSNKDKKDGGRHYRRESANAKNATGMIEDSMGGLHMHHKSVLMEEQQQKSHRGSILSLEETRNDDTAGNTESDDMEAQNGEANIYPMDGNEEENVAGENFNESPMGDEEQDDEKEKAIDGSGDAPSDGRNEDGLDIPLGQDYDGEVGAMDDKDGDDRAIRTEHTECTDNDKTPKMTFDANGSVVTKYDDRRASEVTEGTHFSTKKAIGDAANLPAGHAKNSRRPGKLKLFGETDESGNGTDTSAKSSDGKAIAAAKSGVEEMEVDNVESKTPSAVETKSASTTTAPTHDNRSQVREPHFTIGTIVKVQSRTWPGINKPGGVARVCTVNKDETYNVSYVLGGKESNVDAVFIQKEDQGEDTNESGGSTGAVSTTRRNRRSREKDDDSPPEDLLRQLAAEGFETGFSPPPRKSSKKTSAESGALADSTNDPKQKDSAKQSRGVGAARKRKASPTEPGKFEDAAATRELGCKSDNSSTNKKQRGSKTQDSSITKHSSKEACKLADARYHERFQAAIEEGVVYVATSNLLEYDVNLLKAVCAQVSTGNIALKTTETISKKTTLVVMSIENGCDNDDIRARLRTLKAMRAGLGGIPIVTPKWIAACETEGKVVAPSTFIRSMPTKMKEIEESGETRFGLAKMAAAWQNQPKKPDLPFRDIHVHLCGNFPQDKRSSILQLLREGGAKFVPTPADVSGKLKSAGSSSASTRIVILCGNSGVTLTKAVERGLKEVMESDESSVDVLVVDSKWVFESITCAQPMGAAGFEPSGAKALWRLCLK